MQRYPEQLFADYIPIGVGLWKLIIPNIKNQSVVKTFLCPQLMHQVYLECAYLELLKRNLYSYHLYLDVPSSLYTWFCCLNHLYLSFASGYKPGSCIYHSSLSTNGISWTWFCCLNHLYLRTW